MTYVPCANSDMHVQLERALRNIAKQSGFTIRDTSTNGDYLYSLVLHHLVSIGIDCDCGSLRESAADHLEASRDLYIDFICEAIESEPGHNPETKVCNEDDTSVLDPFLGRFNKYVC